MNSQNKSIADYLKSGHKLTPLQALDLFGCWALSSRISNLKKQGFVIKKNMVKVSEGKKLVAEYYMVAA